jgi:hypothetical protein
VRTSAQTPISIDAPIKKVPQLAILPLPEPASAPHFSCPLHTQSDRPRLTGHKKIREALLLLFCDPVPRECLLLWLLTHSEWRQALHWLNVTGLALYFLDRVDQLDIGDMLPAFVLARLRRNLAGNTERTAALMTEWIDINRDFQNAGMSWANIKGFSLGPPSVPRPELRSQLDLDFLVAETSAPAARRILEDRGYRLRFATRRSMEFNAHDEKPLSLRDLYKPTPHRYVEVHIEPSTSPLLDRVEMFRTHDLSLPVLNPLDLFLGQGLHVYKHLRGEFTRPAHLVEFRRHVIARSNDVAFWRQLRALAEKDPRHPVGLGVVTLLISHLMGSFAPQALTTWTVDCLCPATRLWVKLCAHNAILSGTHGTKFNLLLQETLDPMGMPSPRPLRQSLFPPKLLLPVPNNPNKDLVSTVRRRRQQLRFIVLRVRYHLVEGLRYKFAARRLRKILAQTTP